MGRPSPQLGVVPFAKDAEGDAKPRLAFQKFLPHSSAFPTLSDMLRPATGCRGRKSAWLRIPSKFQEPSVMQTPAEPMSATSRTGLLQTARMAGYTRLPSLLFWLAILAVVLYVSRYTFIRAPAPTPNGFGTVRWGMTLGEVRDVESVPPARVVSSALAYDTTVLGRPCRVSYAFHNERLDAARLQFSAPGVSGLPVFSQQQATQAYKWLKAELSSRYDRLVTTNDYPRESKIISPRGEVTEYETRLQAARQRLADHTHQLREKYLKRYRPDYLNRHRQDIEAAMDRELASDRRYVQDLEQWLNDTLAAERHNPLMSRIESVWELSSWDLRTMSILLFVDFTTSPPGLEIRYKVSPGNRAIAVAGEI